MLIKTNIAQCKIFSVETLVMYNLRTLLLVQKNGVRDATSTTRGSTSFASFAEFFWPWNLLLSTHLTPWRRISSVQGLRSQYRNLKGARSASAKNFSHLTQPKREVAFVVFLSKDFARIKFYQT